MAGRAPSPQRPGAHRLALAALLPGPLQGALDRVRALPQPLAEAPGVVGAEVRPVAPVVRHPVGLAPPVQRPPEDVAGGVQRPLGDGPADVQLQHRDGGLGRAAGPDQGLAGGRLVRPRHPADDADAPVHELPAHRPEVDHQVPVDLAEPDHDGGAQRVEHQLGGRPGLHPGGARDDLRADEGRDQVVGRPARRLRGRRAAQEPGARPPVVRLLQGGVDEGRGARGGDPQDEVPLADAGVADRRAARAAVVLHPLLAPDQGLPSAGDDALHQLGVRAEGGRALRGVQHAEPPAGPGADVEEPAPPPEPRRHVVDDVGHGLRLRGDGVGHRPVLGLDEVDDLPGPRPVDPGGPGIAGLGETRVVGGIGRHGLSVRASRCRWRSVRVGRPVVGSSGATS